MKIENLLIVPSDRIVLAQQARGQRSYLALDRIVKYLKTRLSKSRPLYDGEMQFYDDMPVVLGKENTFVFGEYQRQYFSETVPDDCPYPSCCKTPEPRFVSQGELEYVIKEVDALLVSTRAGQRGTIAIEKAKASDVPVAIIDFQDHESNYGSSDIKKELCRGFIPGKQFDLYFKKDLPLGYWTETILPLCPIPVRPESYEFREVVQEVDIFYSGRKRMERCQPERSEVVDFVRENIDNTLILEHDSRSSFKSTREYCNYLSKCKIALSPSGRVWDSFRHCEVGLTKTAVLLTPKPYVETVGPYLEDDKNAILYDVELVDGRYHLKDSNALAEKIRYYLNNTGELDKIQNAWNKDVLSGHTIAARSQYIIESMGKFI